MRDDKWKFALLKDDKQESAECNLCRLWNKQSLSSDEQFNSVRHFASQIDFTINKPMSLRLAVNLIVFVKKVWWFSS